MLPTQLPRRSGTASRFPWLTVHNPWPKIALTLECRAHTAYKEDSASMNPRDLPEVTAVLPAGRSNAAINTDQQPPRPPARPRELPRPAAGRATANRRRLQLAPPHHRGGPNGSGKQA